MRRFHSRTMLFLGEMVLALLAFALCAAVCAGLLFRAYRISKDSRELNQSVFLAQSAAEAFKREQDMNELAALLSGSAESGRCYVYYNKEWQLTNRENANFVLCVAPSLERGVLYANININKGDETIYSLVSAANAGRVTDEQ